MSVELARLGLVVDADGFVRADKAMQSFNRTAAATEKQAAHVSKELDSMAKFATAAAKVFGVYLTVKPIADYADRWSDLNSKLVNATGNQAAANKAMQGLSQTARTTYSSLEATANSFLRNSMTLKELGYSMERQINLSDALNNSLVISGTKGQQAESVMNALSKAFALGELRGENFNTVIQSGGRTVQALADGLGVGTLELRAMAEAGELKTAKVIDALTSQMEKLREEAEAMPATIGDGFTLMGNSVLEFVGRMDQATGISAAVSAALVGAADSMRDITSDAEKLNAVMGDMSDIAAAVALVYGARLMPIAVGYIRQIEIEVAHTRALTMNREISAAAAISMAEAERALSVATLEGARAQQAKIVAEIENTRMVLASIAAEKQLEAQRIRAQITDKGRQLSVARMAELRTAEVAITGQLAAQEMALGRAMVVSAEAAAASSAAHAGVTAAENAHTAATTRLTAAQRALAASSAAANGALALVGGTVGAIALVAGGLFYKLVQDQKESADAAWRQAEAFDAVLARLGEMQERELTSVAISLNADIEGTRAQIQALERMIEQMNLDPLSDKYKEWQAEISKLNVLLEAQESNQALVIGQLHRLNGVAEDSADAVGRWTDAERESITTLALKRAQLTMSGREAAIFKVRWDEYAKGTAPAVIDVLAEQAALLYDQEVQLKASTEASEAQEKAEEKAIEARERSAQAIAEQIGGMQTELRLIQMSNHQRAIAEALIRATNAARVAGRALTGEEVAAIVAATAALADQEEAIEKRTAAQKAADKEMEKAAEAQKRHLEKVADATRDAMRRADDDLRAFRDSGSDYFADFAMNAESAADAAGKAFERMAYKIVGDLAMSGLLGLFGKGLNIGGSGVGAAGGIESLFSNAGTAGSLFSAAGGSKYLAKVATGGKGVITNAEFEQLMGGKTTSTGLNVTDLKNIGLSIGAGIAGSWAGTELGESVFGKQAESSWGATAGGAVGAIYGPLGAFIGSALGGMVDAAFGGDGKKRANAGFLASPTPGLKDEYNAGDHTFASGLKVTLFARRTDPSAARDIANVFGAVDESFVDLVKELGGKLDMRGKTLRGLDEEATPGSYGNLFGTGGNGTTQGDIAAQLASYLSQLADNVTGLDQALIDSVKSAGSAEEALTLLTQAVIDKEAADKAAKKTEEDLQAATAKALNEKMRLQDEYDDLTMTSTQLLDKQRNALEESNRALFDQVQALKEARRAEEERTAAFEMALDKARDFMSDLRSEQEQMIRDHYSELLDAERDLHNRRFNLFKSLMDLTSSLRLGSLTTLSPRAQLDFAQSQFRSYASTALNTSLSMEDRVTAAEELRKAADDYLAKGQGMYASSTGYKSIFDEVMQTLEAAKFLGVNKEFDPTAIENAQLEELKRINEQLGTLPPDIAARLASLMGNVVSYGVAAGKTPTQLANSILSNTSPAAAQAAEQSFQNTTGRDIYEAATDAQEAAAAIEAQRSASSSEREHVLAMVQQFKNDGLTVARLEAMGVKGADGASVSEILARHGIPSFATGGDHEGGWRLVGERGPELEYTGPSHIYNASDTERMMQGGGANDKAILDQLTRIAQILEGGNRISIADAEQSGSLLRRVAALLEEIKRALDSPGVGSGAYRAAA